MQYYSELNSFDEGIEEADDEFLKELNVLAKLRHKFIVTFYGACLSEKFWLYVVLIILILFTINVTCSEYLNLWRMDL